MTQSLTPNEQAGTFTVSEKNELFVIGMQPCSMENIAAARFDFMGRYGHPAEVIRYNHKAYYELAKQLDRTYYDITTIQGLKMEPDATLPTGAWRVGISKEILTEYEK